MNGGSYTPLIGEIPFMVVGWLQWVASTGLLVRLETMLSSVRNRCAARSCSGPDEQITSGHGIVDS